MFGYTYERYLPFNKNKKKEGKVARMEFCRLQYSSLYVSKIRRGDVQNVQPVISDGSVSRNYGSKDMGIMRRMRRMGIMGAGILLFKGPVS